MKVCIKIAALFAIAAALAMTACGGGSSNGGPGPNGGIIIYSEDGGTINYNGDEIQFVIPENSLPADAEIKIESINDIPAGGADGLMPFGQAYRFTPAGTEFDVSIPAVAEIKYDESLLAQKGFSPDTLSLYYYDEELKAYVAVETYVDKESKKIIANIEHFTIYVPMARARLATNNAPYVANQNPVPNPIRAGAPIYIRTTARDYDGAIAGVSLFYRKLQPSAGAWNEVRMQKEVRLNIADTYGYIIPATFLTSADLGTGNDFEYYVRATDNLGRTTTTATRSLNITRIYNPGTLTITPATLDITAGFERSFTVRGTDTGGTTFTLVPENLSLGGSSGLLMQYYAGGVYYRAQSVTVSADTLTAGFGTEATNATINVYAGDIESIEILDTNGQKINGPLTVPQGANYEFDAVAYDEFGNTILIIPTWSADAEVGTINSDGILSANFTGLGKVYITLGSFSDEQELAYITVESVELDLTEETIKAGETLQITADILPVDATNRNIIWSSSNEAFATVDQTGLVTGIADGDVTITATTADQNESAVCTVHVVTIPVWQTASQIETGDRGAQNPQVAIDASGNAVVVWHQYDGTRDNIWSNRYIAGSGWGTAELIETNNAGRADFPRVAIDASGNAVAVWQQFDGTRNNIWSNRYTVGVGWGTAILIEISNSGTGSPKVAIDALGNAIAVWEQSDGTSVNIWSNRYTAGIGWGTAALIEDSNESVAGSQIVVVPSGNAFVVWQQSDGTRSNIWSNKYTTGIGWGTAVLIETENSGSASSAFIAADSLGNAVAVWTQWDGTAINLFSNRYTLGVGWGTAVLIETDNSGPASLPFIAADSSGNAVAVWTQSDGTRNNIWSNRYTAASGWGTAVLIETDNLGDAAHPRIAVDSSGNAVAVWDQWDGTMYNIWANLCR